MIVNRTDLPVLKPFRLGEREPFRFTIWHGVALLVALAVAVGIGEAQAQAGGQPGIIATIIKWTPLLAQGFRAQHRDELSRDGDRHGDRLAARPRANLAAAAGARLVVVRDAVLPQLAMAGAAVLLHAAAAVRGAHRRYDHSAAGLVQVDHRAVAARDGERVGAGARRGALDPLRPMGVRRVARNDALADAAHGHPAAMREAHDAAVDEPLRHPHGRNAAHLRGRRERGNDLDRRYPLSEARTDLLVPMYLYLLLWFFLYCYPIARATLALEKRFTVDDGGRGRPTSRWSRSRTCTSPSRR